MEMLDKIIYPILRFIMKYSGALISWAWRKHVKILEKNRINEDEEYLKELKKKL